LLLFFARSLLFRRGRRGLKFEVMGKEGKGEGMVVIV
jgi:hypothetical protein